MPAAATAWTEIDDPEHGTYYYNTETGESRWEKPTEAVPAAALSDSPTSNAGTDVSTQSASVESTATTAGAQADGNSTEAGGTKCSLSVDVDGGGRGRGASESSVWTEIADEVNGTYFYNTLTGESRWERPAL